MEKQELSHNLILPRRHNLTSFLLNYIHIIIYLPLMGNKNVK
jgi:hypothetical protein